MKGKCFISQKEPEHAWQKKHIQAIATQSSLPANTHKRIPRNTAHPFQIKLLNHRP
jgi:hypothetical protein